MIKLPETEEDLQQLVDDNTPENVHLDYKASEALSSSKKHEILKDISSFANSDGGILIYGIKEDEKVDEKAPPTISMDDGIDSSSKCNKEWLERIIHNSGISPKITGIKINAILLNNGNYVYAIEIPKSAAAPHQSSDKKYYKRSNSQSNPMEHYEIEDIRNRSHQIESLVNIDVDTKDEKITLIISNKGNWIAEQVSFSISDGIKDNWIKRWGGLPTIFERGLKSFPPQKTYKFHYAHYSEITRYDDIKRLHIEVSYFHSHINAEKTELFDFDFDDYNGSLCEYSPRDNSSLRIPHNIQSSLNNIISSVDSVAGHIREHSKLNGAYLSYFVRDNVEDFIYEYDCRVVDIINSSMLFKQNLSRFIYFINNDKNLVNILEMLPVVDFDSWYEKAKNQYGLVFKQWVFPNDELERLSLLKVVFEKISLGQVKFDYRSTRSFSSPFQVRSSDSYYDDVTEITKLFASFARDLRTLLVKSIKANRSN